jgi:MraZ protein
MSFFSGEYECKVDAKGRMNFPAKLKAKLPESSQSEVVVSRGFEPCLVVYSMVEWKKIYSKVIGLNEFSQEFRRFQRNFFRGNTEVELDTGGRLLIPKTMMKYADIDKEVIVVGLGNRMEIWNPEKYDQFLIQDQDEYAGMAEKFLGGEQ